VVVVTSSHSPAAASADRAASTACSSALPAWALASSREPDGAPAVPVSPLPVWSVPVWSVQVSPVQVSPVPLPVWSVSMSMVR
jgi:hypothetical protein